MWSAVYKSRFHLEWFACVWVGGRAYDRLRVCAVPGRAGQGRAAWVCAHKGAFGRALVAFVSPANGIVRMCVRRLERKGGMAAGPRAALRFCSSVEIFVVSEKNFPSAFSVRSSRRCKPGSAQPKITILTVFLWWLVTGNVVICTGELYREKY